MKRTHIIFFICLPISLQTSQHSNTNVPQKKSKQCLHLPIVQPMIPPQLSEKIIKTALITQQNLKATQQRQPNIVKPQRKPCPSMWHQKYQLPTPPLKFPLIAQHHHPQKADYLARCLSLAESDK